MQCNPVCTSACRKCIWMHGLDNEALYDICLRTLKLSSPSFGDLWSPISWSDELGSALNVTCWGGTTCRFQQLVYGFIMVNEFWSSKAWCQPYSIPPSSLLDGGICSSDLPRLSAISRSHNSWARPANVRRKERDVGANDQCPKQELFLLCGVDSEQCQIQHPWHPDYRHFNGVHPHRKLNIHSRDVQAC